MRRPTPAHVVERIVSLRRHRLTGAHIAAATGVSAATVSRVLKRAGLSRIKDLEPEEPARRYEHDNPGDMIHLDIKKLGRFVRRGHRATGTRAGRRQGSGWEYAHICVDDASRVACGGLFPCYTSKAFAAACKELGVRHVRTKPYTPRTNGGADALQAAGGHGTAPKPARRQASAPAAFRRARACATGAGRAPAWGRGRLSAACGWTGATH